MAELLLGRSHTDRTGNTGPAVAVDVAVKILLVVAVGRAERTALRRTLASTPITVGAVCEQGASCHPGDVGGPSQVSRRFDSLCLPERSQCGDRSLHRLAGLGTRCEGSWARQVPTAE